MNASPPAFESSPMSVDIVPVYQPIVELNTRTIVGYEALTRAIGNESTSPADLFRAAERLGLVNEFDWRCRLSSLRGAIDAHFPPDLTLSINAEPAAIDAPPPAEAGQVLAAARDLSITVEITERNLMRDPAGLLRAVGHARHLGWRIALDDVGADSSSLAMLELLRPDVIKLDMRLLHQPSTPESAAVLDAVACESDRTGAVVLAEGIENAAHEQRALELGATCGQGWLYGYPAALPAFAHGPTHPCGDRVRLTEPPITVREPAAVTPYGLARPQDVAQHADAATLDAMEHDLLTRAALLGPATLVLVTVPSRVDLDPQRRHLLDDLASRTSLTATFDSSPANGRGRHRAVTVGADEPLARERSVIILAPTYAASLIALELEHDDGTPRYSYMLSLDRKVTLDAATLLLRRIPAL